MFFKIVFLLLKLSHVAELIRQEMKDAIRNGNWITNLLFSFGGGAKRPYLQTRHENASIIGRIKNSNITFQSWEGYCWTNSHEKSWAGKMLFCVSLRPQNWLMPCFHFVFNHYVFKLCVFFNHCVAWKNSRLWSSFHHLHCTRKYFDFPATGLVKNLAGLNV